MKSKGTLIFGVVVFFVLTMAISGCNSKDSYNEEYAKYFEEKGYEYIETLDNVETNHIFTYDIAKEIETDISSNTIRKDKLFTIYVDKEFKMEYFPRVKVDKKENILNISANVEFEGEDGIVVEDNHWGLYAEYFLVQNYDLETGKELEKKPVTVFNVDHKLATPQVNYTYDEDELVLSWEKVEGAKQYLVVSFDVYDYNKVDINVIKKVKGSTTSTTIEETLPFYIYSEDAQYAADDEYWWADERVLEYQGKKYGLIALNGEEYSALGELQGFDNEKESCEFAEYAMNEIGYTEEYESISDLPNAVLVSNCDGNTLYRQPILELEDIYEKGSSLHIPYSIKDSIVNGEFVVSKYNDSYKKEAKAQQDIIKAEYKKLKNKEYDYMSNKTVAYNVIQSSSLPEVDDDLYLNDENGEYIAKNLVAGANVIDLSKDEKLRGSENYNYTYLYDMVEEIQHQNPIILKTLWYEVDLINEIMYVHYLFDDDTRKEKQEALRTTVKEVNAQILNDGMSDVDKVYAINDYIRGQTEYDYDAAERITTTLKMDAVYYDSSLASGVFYEKRAVCEGYASAFMLLTRDAGMESIMVTGHSKDEPEVRHAWNRVNIEDNWYLVDVTVNDSDEVSNTALLLPDEMGDLLYEEDEYYVIDSKLDTYTAKGNQYEYYHYNGFVVTSDTAVDKLVELLNSNQPAVVRLPLTTTDDEFSQISQQVVDRVRRNGHAYRLHGVLGIYLY